MNKSIYIIILLCLILVSCSSKEEPIQQLNNLSEEIETNGDSYSDEDWDNAFLQYESIENELGKYKYTDEEQKNIGSLKTKIGYKFTVKFGKNKINQFYNEMSGAVDELVNDHDKDSEKK